MTAKRDLGTYRPVVTDEILIAEFRKNRAPIAGIVGGNCEGTGGCNRALSNQMARRIMGENLTTLRRGA
jgi:hypothetical protein